EIYPTVDCGLSCALVSQILGASIPIGYRCPNGDKDIGVSCFTPFIDGTDPADPRCVVHDSGTTCAGNDLDVDYRVYNQTVYVLTSEMPAAYQDPLATYQAAVDRAGRIMNGAYYRMHMDKPSSYNTRFYCASQLTQVACNGHAADGCSWNGTKCVGGDYTG